MERLTNTMKKFSLGGKVALGVLTSFLILAVFAGLLTTHPHEIPSGPGLVPPSGDHFLGTDDLGIDLWAQLVYGTRISLLVGLSTALISVALGGSLGIIAGYYGGGVDEKIMALVDMMLVVPQLPTMVVLGGFFGPSIVNIVLVLSLFSWARPARMVRSRILSLKEEPFINIAKSYGGGIFYITRKHFMPEIFALLMVSFIRLISRAVVAEAGLSFLGLGDPTNKSWGLILNHALGFRGIYFTDFWKWWVISPLLFIILLVLSVSFISKEVENIYLGR